MLTNFVVSTLVADFSATGTNRRITEEQLIDHFHDMLVCSENENEKE